MRRQRRHLTRPVPIHSERGCPLIVYTLGPYRATLEVLLYLDRQDIESVVTTAEFAFALSGMVLEDDDVFVHRFYGGGPLIAVVIGEGALPLVAYWCEVEGRLSYQPKPIPNLGRG